MKPHSSTDTHDRAGAPSDLGPKRALGLSSGVPGTHSHTLPTLPQNLSDSLLLSLPRKPEKPSKQRGQAGTGARTVTAGRCPQPHRARLPRDPPHRAGEGAGPSPLYGRDPRAAGPRPSPRGGGEGQEPAGSPRTPVQRCRRNKRAAAPRQRRSARGGGAGRDAATVPPGGPGTPVPWGRPSPSVSGSRRPAAQPVTSVPSAATPGRRGVPKPAAAGFPRPRSMVRPHPPCVQAHPGRAIHGQRGAGEGGRGLRGSPAAHVTDCMQRNRLSAGSPRPQCPRPAPLGPPAAPAPRGGGGGGS